MYTWALTVGIMIAIYLNSVADLQILYHKRVKKFIFLQVVIIYISLGHLQRKVPVYSLRIKINDSLLKSAGAVDYSDCTSSEG